METKSTPPNANRTRNATNQAEMLRKAAQESWGGRAWSRFSDEEKERHLAVEFMRLLAAQVDSEDNPALNHYRATARALFGAPEEA